MKKILLIEDDPVLNRNIKEALTAEQMEVESVFDGLLAERLLKREMFDCLVLDINLPGKNGFDLCKAFREYNASTPVLMLTAFDELEDKVKGFECGADDYLTKPFYIRELILRVHSLLKRSATRQQPEKRESTLAVSDLVVHLGHKKVSRQGVDIPLTPREYQILVKLLQAGGELVSKKDLIRTIWGSVVDANTNTVEVYINFLRNKIDKPFGKESIKTKIGFGYYFESQ
ncbi:response regulator transcription factor [Rapidithrix thailandica]|uniref:Response regulator transcription factor n=1 Tax=Rapidithrix thailandica TaxID=413964 RepID=A0AAW9RR62_9BACT